MLIQSQFFIIPTRLFVLHLKETLVNLLQLYSEYVFSSFNTRTCIECAVRPGAKACEDDISLSLLSSRISAPIWWSQRHWRQPVRQIKLWCFIPALQISWNPPFPSPLSFGRTPLFAAFVGVALRGHRTLLRWSYIQYGA